MYNPEKVTSPEVEKKVETKIILEFMRHGEPESWKESQPDERRRLTEKGRAQSDEKGRKLNPQADVSLAWSSHRDRAKETAYRTMLADENINPDAGLEDIEKVISEELKVGKKIISDKRLDYNDEGELGDLLWEADDKGEFLDWLVNKSDKEALKYPGNETITYTRAAGNIAEIIGRYAKIGNNFNRIASKAGKYEKFGNQLERYLGTHQGIVELFIAKIIEKAEGVEERNEFIKALGEGFELTEGPRIEISSKDSEQNIYMAYKNAEGKEEKIEIKKELLEEIIKDKENFEKSIESQK
ncbi:MAG: phosphoglycerate mutase family protein [Candidatus Moranbacteria bacterium]|nr:phosphoglycerate mutase family protein [Candidatus Moranbacteria bacterium]